MLSERIYDKLIFFFKEKIKVKVYNYDTNLQYCTVQEK